MGALLNNGAVLHHQNQIGAFNGGQSVRNNKGSAPLHQGQECLLNSHLRSGINRGSRLIQDQHRRIAQHNAGDTKQLLLSLRQAAAVLTDLGTNTPPADA